MKTLRELKKIAKVELNTPQIKVALLGDTVTRLLVTAIKGEAVDRGVSLDLYEGEYSQVERQMMGNKAREVAGLYRKELITPKWEQTYLSC